MQINDGTEPRQDAHDCTHYVNVRCGCKPGECEQQFRVRGKLGDNDLENFSLDQLNQINTGNSIAIFNIEELLYRAIFTKNEHKETTYMSLLETLYAFRITLHNAINKVKLKS